jgi:hypothetical protein
MLRLVLRARLPLAQRQCQCFPSTPLLSSRFVNGRTIFNSSVRLADSPTASSAASSNASVGSRSGRALAWKSAKFCGFLVGSMGLGLVTFLGVIFIHDAFTYTTRHIERVPVSPLALHPELGGPKNLPVARVLIDDEEVCVTPLARRADACSHTIGQCEQVPRNKT